MGDAIIMMRGGIYDPIESLEVTTAPTKTRYLEGENLDLAGIVVTANFKNGQKTIVTEECTFSPANGTTLHPSIQTIVISWKHGRKTYETAQLLDVVAMSELWSRGTDEEVVSMITAARQGQYNLSDYWKVGDKRTITLNSIDGVGGGAKHRSQQVDIVISEFGGKKLQDNTTCLMQWDFKHCMEQECVMNTTDTNAGGYESTVIAPWLDNKVFYALPAWLQGVSKPFYMTTGRGNGSSYVNTKVHKLGLRTAKEIAGTSGTSGWGNVAEASANNHITYYQTTKNRDKGKTHTWLATDIVDPDDNHSTTRCFTGLYNNQYGTFSFTSLLADNACGIAPYGCI